MNVPFVSVIMPVYNGACWLPESLASIRRQAVPGLEIIVFDDGSTEDIAPVVRMHCPEARYLRHENRGPAATRNVALGHATGALITFLDHDDVWPDGSLAARLRALAENPAALFVLGRTRFLATGETPDPWVGTNLGAGLYRRELFSRVGLLNERCEFIEDVEWFLRVREAGLPYVTIADVTLHYRRGTGGVTHGRSWGEAEVLATVRASLSRRRQAGAVAPELPLLSGSKTDPRAAGPVNHGPPCDQAH
jgi:glycosyltransferase involved in cell wall biosynthesis